MREITSTEFHEFAQELGLNLLSGESCNMGLRITTDVSPLAAPLVERFMSVKLVNPGMNGWGIDPNGACHAGYNSAYEYVDNSRQKKPGWNTSPGFTFHMPRSLLKDLLVYLALAERKCIRCLVYVEGKRRDYGNLESRIYLLDSWAEQEAWNDIERPFFEKEGVGYKFFFPEDVPANTHHFSGFNIDNTTGE